MTLTPRDNDLLRTLVLHVRALSVLQVANTWWPEARASTAHARLRDLHDASYVALTPQAVGAVSQPTEPLATWQPGLPIPDLATVAAFARTRWRRPPTVVLCATATRLAAAQFGVGTERAPRPTEWTHDLYLAGVYLWMRTALPTRARSWRHEDREDHGAAIRTGAKLPDAIVTDGRDTTAIEVVGSSYTREKLEAFHAYCAGAQLSYDLW